MVAAAQRMVPVLIGLMAFAFSTYLILKGLDKILKVAASTAFIVGALVGLLTYWLLGRSISGRSETLENNKKSINALFTVPLICAAALLSFAHGANDVANAVGPLAAIADAVNPDLHHDGHPGADRIPSPRLPAPIGVRRNDVDDRCMWNYRYSKEFNFNFVAFYRRSNIGFI